MYVYAKNIIKQKKMLKIILLFSYGITYIHIKPIENMLHDEVIKRIETCIVSHIVSLNVVMLERPRTQYVQ